MSITYDCRFVSVHDNDSIAQVLLMNEAPGPDEAASGIPLYGQQGANLFHALRAAGIEWAVNHEKFVWPKNDSVQSDVRQSKKKSFLATRAKHITCTNSYPYWPKPNDEPNSFCPPDKEKVLEQTNIRRLKNEIAPTHTVLLICGRYAYIACTGNELHQPENREFTELTEVEIESVNSRLNAKFKIGWYMGHTRRWSLNQHSATSILRKISEYLNWAITEDFIKGV